MRPLMPSVFDRVPPLVLVLGGIVSIQLGAAFATTLFDELGASGVSLLRLGLAAIVLLAVWRPRPSAHARADLRLAAAFGLCLGLMNLSFYEAIARIPLGIAVTVEFIGPLGVAVVLSRRRRDLAWVVLAGLGILLLADPGGGGADATGRARAARAGAVGFGYVLRAARAGQRFAGGTGLALAMGVAALVVVGPGVASAGADLLRPELLAFGFAVAVLSSVVPFTLETEALRRLPAGVFGVLMSLEPAVAALVGLVALGQGLVAREVVAMALVVAASAGATRSGAPPPAAPPDPA